MAKLNMSKQEVLVAMRSTHMDLLQQSAAQGNQFLSSATLLKLHLSTMSSVGQYKKVTDIAE